uniref:Uncharacterized protein n=1 Tax=candidate division WOR-3 bacterium TaxID=2052148 RepID=A0A7C4C9Z9_UNCW3
MKRKLLFVAVLLLVFACDLPWSFDDFQPTGTPFNLNPAIELKSITGSLRHFSPVGQFALDLTAKSRTDTTAGDVLPAGLLFTSPRNTTQHMVMLKDHIIRVRAESVLVAGVFCCNERRAVPGPDDHLTLGPLTDNSGLRQIAELVRHKNISGSLALVQRAVWMVTDSSGLNQAYIDSLNALPAEGL